MDVHRQPWIADAPADEGGVKHQRLDEPVVRSPQNPVTVRFFHPSGRIGAGVDQDEAVHPVHQQGQLTGQHRNQHRLRILLGIHLHIGDEPAGKPLGAGNILYFLRLQGHNIFEDFFHHFVFDETIDEKQHGVPPADKDLPGDHIKTFLHAQQGFHVIGAAGKRQIRHRCSPLFIKSLYSVPAWRTDYYVLMKESRQSCADTSFMLY